MKTHIQPLPELLLQNIIRDALLEDFGTGGDITSLATISADLNDSFVAIAREDGVISGVDIASKVFKTADSQLEVEVLKADGTGVKAGEPVLRVSGSARNILSAERVALNFIGRMSGIASLTAMMQSACVPHRARVAATRKTTPGFRMIEKYAVRCGGGLPHRMRLDDAVMIKDNHIAANNGDIVKTLTAAREYAGHTIKIEVEVDNLSQYKIVQDCGLADIILLDNMSCADMRHAVQNNPCGAVLEASGNVTLQTISDIAATGVDVISIGALTHSAPNFDIGLDSRSIVQEAYRDGVKTASTL